MAQLLVNVVFGILNFIAKLVLSPVLGLASAVIPRFFAIY